MNKGTFKNEGTLDNAGRLNSNAEIENVSGNTVYPASYNYIDSSKFVYTKGKDKDAVFNNSATSETTFTVTEPVVVNPNTYDNIITYISLLGLSIIGLEINTKLKNNL